MGPVPKLVRKRVGSLSAKLHELFRQYLASGKVPSVQSLKRANFKFWPGKCYAPRVGVPVTGVETDKLRTKKYAEGFVLERFRAWAKRMKVRQDGCLTFVGNDKIIIPKEHFPDLVRKVHTRNGACGLKHRSLMKTLKLLRNLYSIGRRQFGVTPQLVKTIIQSCSDKNCFAKQYSLRRKRDTPDISKGTAKLTNSNFCVKSVCHNAESDMSFAESPSVNDTSDDDVDVGNPSDDHEADKGHGSDRSTSVMQEQPRRDDMSHEIPPRERSTHAAIRKQLNTTFHGGEEKTCRKSTKKTSSSSAHTVHAPLWTPPSSNEAPPKKTHKGGKSECLPSDHDNTSGSGREHSEKQMRHGKREIVPSVGATQTSNNDKSSAEPVRANKPAHVEPRKIMPDDQHERNKNAGSTVAMHANKFGQLLEVVRQMRMDVGPACINNLLAVERLKRKIHTGLCVLVDCRSLLHNYEEMRR